MKSEKEIWVDYYNIFLDIKKKLEIEMEWFAIDSCQLLNVMLPYLESIVANGKIIEEKIQMPEILFISKELCISYIKTISELSFSNNLDEIEYWLKEFIQEIQKYIQENKIETLVSELSDCIDWITKDEILTYYEKYIDLWYHEISSLILKEQELKNNIPDTDKQSFFENYPEFEDLVDKDGLTNISLLECEISRYWIYYKDYFLYFDEQIWMISSWYYFFHEFFSAKWHYSNKTHFKLSLNFDKIISRNKYKQLNRFWWYHYWPDFKLESFFTKADKIEFTRKIRLNPKFDNYSWYKIFATEFCIDQRDNSFLIEEIWEKIFKEYFLNRLIHSEFDLENSSISHFDGSILFYDKSSLEIRQNVTLDKRPKLSKKKKKLFRIDWKLEFEDFKKILFAFYFWNEMILEYFDFDEYKKTYSHILDYENWIDY